MKSFNAQIGIIHFIGIGGIGMSGIAEVLLNLGFEVSGSDLSENQNVVRLRKLGAKIYIGHDKSKLNEIAMVVVSSAISSNNEELLEARLRRLPIVKRAEMLAELMRFKKTIAVGGSHGKTTTTSLMANILEHAGYDPTVINGGIINSYKSNAKLGSSDWMIVEADESDGSFLKLPSSNVIVTNIDLEHLDFYKDYTTLKEAFKTFINNIPFYGHAIICLDNPNIQNIISEIEDKRIVTYGISPQSDFRALDIRFQKNETIFNLEVSPRIDAPIKKVENLISKIPGIHNVQNSLAACAMAMELGISVELIKMGLEKFDGVNRRFSDIGNYKGIKIIDDYGHHPAEIKASLSAAREISRNNVLAVIQPHRYSRLKILYEEFMTSFNDADYVYVMDIYSAGEGKIENVTKDNFIGSLISSGHKHVRPFSDIKSLKEFCDKKLSTGDIIIFLGAGDITNVAKDFVNYSTIKC